jgi:hypothetical protein
MLSNEENNMEAILFIIEAGQYIPLLLLEGNASYDMCLEVLDTLTIVAPDREFACVMYREA